MLRPIVSLTLPILSFAQIFYRPTYVYSSALSYSPQPWSHTRLHYSPRRQQAQGYQQVNQFQQPSPVSGYPVFPWGVAGIYGNSYRPNPSVVQPPNSGTQSGSTCPKGPYATFLSQQEQEGLHELVVEARKSGAAEAQVKEYINRYMQAVLSTEKFEKFTEAMNNFNAVRSRLRN